MARVLVIHGAGMNMRGKVQTEIFGPMTLPEYDERIRGYAARARPRGRDLPFEYRRRDRQQALRGERRRHRRGDLQPGGVRLRLSGAVAAISQVKFPTIEVHISNPIRRGPASQTAAVSQGVVAGFGIAGYELALRGLRDMLAAKK